VCGAATRRADQRESEKGQRPQEHGPQVVVR
jgi:hypothetical protein